MGSDIRRAVRQLIRRPVFSLLVVLTLAVGISATGAVFSFVNAFLLRPLPFVEAERIVQIESTRGGRRGRISRQEFEELKRRTRLLESVATVYTSQYNITGGGTPEAVRCAVSTSNLFEVMGARVLHGAVWPSAIDFTEQYTVVLNYAFWKRRFGGDPAIIGRSILLDGAAYQVTGVMEESFHFPENVEVYRAVTNYNPLEARRHIVMAKLKPGMSIAQLRAELEVQSRDLETMFPSANRAVVLEAQSLRDSYSGDVRPWLLLLSGAVGCVLLLACANAGNLLLARGIERGSEIAVMCALGCPRRRIVQQLFVESAALAIVGAISGVLLSFLWLKLFTAWIGFDLPAWIKLEPDWRILLFVGAVTGVTAILTGLTPALSQSVAPSGALRGSRGTSATRKQNQARLILTVSQVSLAMLLLSVAGLMIRSFVTLNQVQTGFNAASLLTFRADPPFKRYETIGQISPFYRRAFDKLREIPGVTGVAANQNLPMAHMDGNTKRIVTVEGQSTAEQKHNPFVSVQPVNPDYFKVMQIPLLSGRAFSDFDVEGKAQVAVVSRTLAERLWRGVDPVGKRLMLGVPDQKVTGKDLTYGMGWWTVVGVAGDVRSESVLSGPGFDLYFPIYQYFAGDAFFILRTASDPASVAPYIQNTILSVDPEQSIFDVRTMEARVSDTIWQQRLASWLISGFGVSSLALAGVGLFGVVSRTVSGRKREIGIRIALGAEPSQVRGLVLRRAFLVGSAGVLIGGATCVGAGLALHSLLFEVSPLDGLTYCAATVAVFVVVIAAAWVPAARAAGTSPSVVLRLE